MAIKTKMPVRRNNNPTKQEMAVRRAIHILQDACDDQVVLMSNEEHSVYLIPAIMDENGGDMDNEDKPKPVGMVEYQVSDGLPGERCHSDDFTNLQEAIDHFNAVIEAGGWAEYAKKEREKRDAS